MNRVSLFLKINKLIHDECKDVPHDIGLRIGELMEQGQKETKIIYFRESFLQSFASDVVTYAGLFAAIYISRGNIVWSIVLIVIFFLLLSAPLRAKQKIVFTDLDKLKKHVAELK